MLWLTLGRTESQRVFAAIHGPCSCSLNVQFNVASRQIHDWTVYNILQGSAKFGLWSTVASDHHVIMFCLPAITTWHADVDAFYGTCLTIQEYLIVIFLWSEFKLYKMWNLNQRTNTANSFQHIFRVLDINCKTSCKNFKTNEQIYQQMYCNILLPLLKMGISKSIKCISTQTGHW